MPKNTMIIIDYATLLISAPRPNCPVCSDADEACQQCAGQVDQDLAARDLVYAHCWAHRASQDMYVQMEPGLSIEQGREALLSASPSVDVDVLIMGHFIWPYRTVNAYLQDGQTLVPLEA